MVVRELLREIDRRHRVQILIQVLHQGKPSPNKLLVVGADPGVESLSPVARGEVDGCQLVELVSPIEIGAKSGVGLVGGVYVATFVVSNTVQNIAVANEVQ